MTISGERLDAVVAEAVAGNRDALREVLETIRPIVVRYCRARVGTAERSGLSADDVAQEVCLAAITALPRYKDQGRPFLAFVYGIAAHKVADAHRAAARNRADPTDVVPERYSLEAGPEQMASGLRIVGPDEQAPVRAAREAARDPDPARGRRHERRGDRRGGRQHGRRGPGRAAPRAGAAEGRNHRDGARPCLTSDAGAPTGAIRRSTRSTARTDSSTRWPIEQPVYSTDPSEAELAHLMAGWRDEMRTPPLMSPVTPPRRGGRADARRRVAQAHAHVDGRWWVRSPRRVLCLGGFGAVVAGAGPGDRALRVAHDAVRRADSAPATTRWRWPRRQMAEVQQLIDEGQWEQAQDKLQTVTHDRGDGRMTLSRNRNWSTQWQDLTVKVDAKDPNATLPPGVPPPVMPEPVVVAPDSTDVDHHVVGDERTDTVTVGDHHVRRPRRRRRPPRPSSPTTSSPTTTRVPPRLSRRRRVRRRRRPRRSRAADDHVAAGNVDPDDADNDHARGHDDRPTTTSQAAAPPVAAPPAVAARRPWTARPAATSAMRRPQVQTPRLAVAIRPSAAAPRSSRPRRQPPSRRRGTAVLKARPRKARRLRIRSPRTSRR